MRELPDLARRVQQRVDQEVETELLRELEGYPGQRRSQAEFNSIVLYSELVVTLAARLCSAPWPAVFTAAASDDDRVCGVRTALGLLRPLFHLVHKGITDVMVKERAAAAGSIADSSTRITQALLQALLQQFLDADLVGASAGAMAALRRPPGEAAPWLQTVQLTLDVFMFIHMFLDAARCLPGVDASVADAIWKRCREVRLPQNLIKAYSVVWGRGHAGAGKAITLLKTIICDHIDDRSAAARQLPNLQALRTEFGSDAEVFPIVLGLAISAARSVRGITSMPELRSSGFTQLMIDCLTILHYQIEKHHAPAPARQLQELLRGEGPLMFSLGTFAIGSSAMFDYAHPSAMFALAVVKLLASKPLPFRVDAALSRELSAWMLEAAGMAAKLAGLLEMPAHQQPHARREAVKVGVMHEQVHQALLLGTAPIDQPEFSWATPDPGGTFVDRLHTMAAALVEAVSIMLAEGSAFTRGLDDDTEVWMVNALYCSAMEALLRLAARDTERFSDLTGREDKPQVLAVFSVTHRRVRAGVCDAAPRLAATARKMIPMLRGRSDGPSGVDLASANLLLFAGCRSPQTAPPPFGCSSSTCQNMSGPSEQLLVTRLCSRCRRTQYCSTECQSAHWAAHKAVCKAARAA